MDKEKINGFPIIKYTGMVHLVRSSAEVITAVEQLVVETILGFDTETRPAYKKGQHFMPSILQLAGAESVFIFQLRQITRITPLKDILADVNIVKTGVALDYDISELQPLVQFSPAGFVDLGKHAKKAGIKNYGLRGLAAVLLGGRIAKSAQCTNWAKNNLTPAQIKYAATDAWVGRELYLRLQQQDLL